MRNKVINWGIFILLSFIWGSSFILMKEGMIALSPYQVASIRILSAGIVLIPFAYKAFKQIPANKILLVILSGLLGNFFPAYLFCIAETKIDSSLAGILNALTPMFTIILGFSFFQLQTTRIKVIGIMIGFTGLCLLMVSNGINLTNIAYAGLVLVATVCYGINVNMVSRYMHQMGSLNIASMAFVLLMIPSAIILYSTGYFSLDLQSKQTLLSSFDAFILGMMGTAVASILFYMLLKRAGTLFASMVTYGIPFVAVLWGLVDGEKITLLQVGCLAIILSGVYLVSKKEKSSSN